MSKAHPPELKKYMDKRLSLKLNANRQVTGILRGFDPFMNLVIDEAVEINKRNQQIPIDTNTDMALKYSMFAYIVNLIIISMYIEYFISYFHSKCYDGHFELSNYCYKFLDCSDVKYIKPIRLLTRGTVKNIWLVEWNHHLMVMSTLANNEFKEDFDKNIENIFKLKNNHEYIIEFYGKCGNSIFTEYHPNGNLNNLHSKKLNFRQRFNYCYKYVEILNYLHRNSMVMCDSNDLQKTLSQYLITNDERLIVLNDLDALPLVDGNKKIKCGKRPIFGEFNAPEQRFTLINDQLYDHKIDTWKIPDICHWILTENVDNLNDNEKFCRKFQEKLFNFIHQKCKSIDPNSRPEAYDILKFYYLIQLIC